MAVVDRARSDHPGVQAQLHRLAQLSPGGDRLGLDRITRLLDRLGRPHAALPPVFHVAGTNGKGSTCAFLRAALEAAGHRVHLFTSPHLVRFNERFRLAGKLIEDGALAQLLAEVLDASTGIEPSFFEVATAAAFLAFSREPADAVILEVGMGGRLDATNVIERPLVCGIAALGIDHQHWLGSSLAEIAGEKAGIAKPGVPLVTLKYEPTAAARVRAVAAERGANWLPCGSAWNSAANGSGIHYRDCRGELLLPRPRLPGLHQHQNAALAVAMLRHQDRLLVPESALVVAMGAVEWPARLQKLGPGPLIGSREVWLDGGHNADAAQALAEAVRGMAPFTLIASSLRIKDPRGLLAPFRGLASQVHAVPIAEHDSFMPAELADIATELGMPANPFGGIEDALAAAPAGRPVLIAGSLYLAGEVLALNGEAPA
ncbi:MAG: Dihydrofolate synthase @ Folylpolyglutamate synthase [uncultured Sphingomonas sp.]|uniref:tetrahydrofolate synthase n=1 Tax=uncultured Sphingomonas sp. TaxID=158754 RepID=A0A6J4SYN2_9SPHN|nr:MAG: Dihydrofolate synthase @ Folylpolyglutamate synthase [uncultured Sphingomonas sp.]